MDDHELVRRGLALTVEDGIENAEAVEAGSTDEAVRLLEVSPVDIALVDVRMPGRDGIELLKEIKARWPEVPVVMLTTFDHASYARAALAAGAAGYLLKDSTPADLTQAMRAAMAGGGNVLSGKVTHGLFEEERHRARARPTSPRRPAELTLRETQILELLVGGRGNKELAGQLGLSEKTVKAHLAAIFRKLGVGNRTQAAMTAIAMGIASSPTAVTKLADHDGTAAVTE